MEENNRVIKDGNTDYGTIGEPTGSYGYALPFDGRPIHVGDVVSYTTKHGTNTGVVMQGRDGKYGVMGWGVNNLNLDRISIVIPYEKLTEYIINTLHDRGGFTIEEVSAEEMTVEEIEKALGKRIKIVK